ncbi:MAG: hypothetical protein M3313_11300, partial [Actinomycetota bacterium]|nr:hypothetical protein [Actinomycetota bacterium]
ETLSHGSMSFEFEHGWHNDSATGEAEAIDAVRAGSADFAVVPVRAWHAAGVPSFDALVAPMAVDSYALQDAVLQDDMVQEMLAAVDELGLTGIGILPGPMRKPAGISRELLGPADFQGARIAISAGEVAERTLSELGANAVPSPFEGADMSGFDGLEQQVASIAGNQYDGVVTSLTTNLNLWPRSYVVVGNADAVEALSSEQRELLLSAARQAVSPTSVMQQTAEHDAVQQICNRSRLTFVAATDEQVQQLRDALEPVASWLAEDEQTAGFMQRIEELRTDIAAGSEASPDCTGTSPGATNDPTGAVTPIDGVYEMTSTLEEAQAAGFLSGTPCDLANYGTYTWIFDQGRYVETQRNGDTENSASGTYTVDGDELTMRVTEGGGSGPGAECHRHPGEVDTWIWSLYRNQLTIRWFDPSVTEYPANYAIKPWTRIGDAP